LPRKPTVGDLRKNYTSIAEVARLRLKDSAAPRIDWSLQLALVIVCVGASALLQWIANLFAPEMVSYAPFLPAVAIVALFAGAWAGLATLLLSLTINLTLFAAPPADSFSRVHLVGATLFVIAGLVQLFLAVLLRETIWHVRRSEVRHRALLQALTEIVWESDGAGGGLERQPAWEALTGMSWPEYRGLGWLNAVHPDDRALIIPKKPSEGQLFIADARVRDHRNNDWRWFRIRALPLHGESGRIDRWIGSLDDIHEERMAGERSELQVGELRHRLKNLIAVIQALITYSQPKGEPKVEEFAKKFMARLHALGSSGDLVIASNLQDVEVGEAIRASLRPFILETNAQLKIEGPSVRLQEPTAAGIALAIHELATNALKYGALSMPGGRAEIIWRVEPHEGAEQFHLEWREVGGPPAHKPNREGFGTRLIRMAVAREKDASVSIDFAQTGLVCRMTFTRVEQI
jgi:PAS domain S-box-containing protein